METTDDLLKMIDAVAYSCDCLIEYSSECEDLELQEDIYLEAKYIALIMEKLEKALKSGCNNFKMSENE